MKRNWLIIIVASLALILIGLIVKNKFFGRPGPGALQISTTPKATVFIDGTQVGVTPFFDDKLKSGEHTVKLVPEATTDSLVSWEGKVNLTPGILTAINRNFATSEAFSSGEIIWLEKISSRDKSSLSVISTPDQAVVKVDSEPKGFSPVLVENLSPGSHQLIVGTPGYEERTISAKTVAGYKLIVNVQLAQKIEGIEEATPSAETTSPTPSPKATPSPKTTPKPTVTPPEKPYVLIKETPTGWLRVRMEPSASATEAAKVNPGEMFPYLNEEKSGWYKIEYEEGKEGWVSGVYVELVK
ncbi:MAG: Uncharacterized protein LiPW31_52 [Microgenomates group bacterium LiPW_31]|nr:MAG: Uncharacterized protein LiPW31_52 [Microgenomates group bacterium LiPW_31]